MDEPEVADAAMGGAPPGEGATPGPPLASAGAFAGGPALPPRSAGGPLDAPGGQPLLPPQGPAAAAAGRGAPATAASSSGGPAAEGGDASQANGTLDSLQAQALLERLKHFATLDDPRALLVAEAEALGLGKSQASLGGAPLGSTPGRASQAGLGGAPFGSTPGRLSCQAAEAAGATGAGAEAPALGLEETPFRFPPGSAKTA